MSTRTAGRRSSVPARLYLLHVQLAEVEPPIWRRLAVPGLRTLHALHGILQAAMPWQDYHLYQFEIGGTRYEDPDPDDPTRPSLIRGDSPSTKWHWSKVAGFSTRTTSGTAGSTTSGSKASYVCPEIFCFRSASVAPAPVRRRIVVGSAAMRSWSRRCGDRGRQRLGSTARWGGCLILRSSTSRRSMCGSAIVHHRAAEPAPASGGAALSNQRMQLAGARVASTRARRSAAARWTIEFVSAGLAARS